MIKNYGFDPKREVEEHSKEDWLFQGESVDLKGKSEKIDNVERYLPDGEIQKGKQDTMDCASRGPNNILETKLNYLYITHTMSLGNRQFLEENDYVVNGKIELSDAFTAIISKTTRRGNSMKAPLEAMRKFGSYPKKRMPLEPHMTWSQYHNSNRITKASLELGKKFKSRFPIYYLRVSRQDFKHVIKYDIIDVAGHAWSSPIKGIYPRTTRRMNHVFIYHREPQYTIFDNYLDRGIANDYIKRLASNYYLYSSGYRLILNEVEHYPTEGYAPMSKLVRDPDNTDEVYAIGLGKKSHIANEYTLEMGSGMYWEYVYGVTIPVADDSFSKLETVPETILSPADKKLAGKQGIWNKIKSLFFN